MKEVPECLWNDLASSESFTRPWWRRISNGSYQRVGGGVLTFEGTYCSHNRSYGATLLGAQEAYDKAHPLDKPLPCVGQVWGWSDGSVDAIVRKVVTGGKPRYVFSDDTVYEDVVTKSAFLLQDPKGRFWAPAS